MIEQNSQLKTNFDSYDVSKDKFVTEMITNLEESNKKEFEKYFCI